MLAKTKITPLMAFALSYIIWGLNAPLVKIGLGTLPISIFLASKFIIASIIMLPWLVKHLKTIKLKVLFRIIIATFVGYVLHLILWYFGIRKTTASTAELIVSFGPVILFALSVKILREKFNSKILYGLIISALGTIFIVALPQISGSQLNVSLTGNLFILLAVFADVFGTLLIKPTFKIVGAEQIAALRIVIATVFFSLLALNDLSSFKLSQVDSGGYISIIVGAIVAIVIGLSLYHYGLSRISVEKSSVLHYLEPIFGIVASIIILGEQLTTSFLLGAILIFWGIYIAEARLHHSFFHLTHHRH